MTTRARARRSTKAKTIKRPRRSSTRDARKVALTNGRGNRPTTPSIKPDGSLPPPTQQQGSDAVAAYGGYVTHGEKNNELVGENLWRTYSELIASTCIVAAAVRYSLNLISGVTWEVSPNPRCKDQSLAKKCADIVREGLIEADMTLPWSNFAAKQALFKWYGFAMHNWMFRKRSDGMKVFADLRHRPQHTIKRWDITSEGEPWQGVEQQTRNGGIYYIDRSRLWYTADLTLTDLPMGVGMLRHIVEHCRRLKEYETLEGVGHEANLRGVPYARGPLQEMWEYARGQLKKNEAGADAYVEDQTTEVRSFLKNHIKQPDQGLLLDSAVYTAMSNGGKTISSVPKWVIELLQGDDMGLPATANVIERLNREIARVMFFEFALMGDSEGARAVHEDKTTQYGAFLNSTTKELGNSSRNDLARPLVAANFGEEAAEEATPMIEPNPISTEDITTATQAVLNMVNAGMYAPPDDPIWNQLRKRAHFAAQPKLPPEVTGALARVPRDPNDPANPANGGDGRPPRRGAPANDDASNAAAKDPQANADDGDDLADRDRPANEKPDEQPRKRRRKAA